MIPQMPIVNNSSHIPSTTISKRRAEALESHIREKVDNRGGLVDNIRRQTVQCPYNASDKEATVAMRIIKPKCQSINLANVPTAHRSAGTHGYIVEGTNELLIELGAYLHMACRQAMNDVINCVASFPESGSIFCAKPDDKLLLSERSFRVKRRNLKNRHFIQKSLKTKSLEQDTAFSADGEITTAQEKMIAPKNIAVTKINSSNLRDEKNLKALRDISRIVPMQWAENLCIALNFEVFHSNDVKKSMSKLFSLYDPISLIFAFKDFSPAIVDHVFKNYESSFSEEEIEIQYSTWEELLGMGMKVEMVYHIELAAQASGLAIYKILAKELGIGV